MRRIRVWGLVALLLGVTACVPAGVGSALIVRPLRLPRLRTPSLPYETVRVRSEDVELEGWLFRPAGPSRALVVYLHGKDNQRTTGADLAELLVPRGFTVLAYDQRAHGASGGTFCTYGVHEVADLQRVLDAVGGEEVYVVGESLGAAVGLQAAAVDARIRGVVAAAAFSDLETIVREQAPSFARPGDMEAAIAKAEAEAGFHLADVSPVRVARDIHVPVLLVHGTQDGFTRLDHSLRIYAALAGPRRFVPIQGAGHPDILRHREVWDLIVRWVEQVDAPGRATSTGP